MAVEQQPVLAFGAMASGGEQLRLRGRDGESRRLRDLIGAAKGGSSGVIVLRGEAGVGKTSLLDYAATVDPAFRVVHVAGVESDMELAFAGLQQLCAPLLEYADGLPAPQRDALNVAFGLGAGPVPDRFLVGLAVLSLMAAAAQRRPLLCIVDDAQWLDQVTVQTLGFVARRLAAEPVVMVFAVRDRAEVLAGLPELVVEGLSDRDARELLDDVMIGGIDPRVRDRIVGETRGVPLAILEVPRTVSPTELAGGFWISGKRSSTAALETEFVRRVQALPRQTQVLLLVAAAEPIGDPALFLGAAAHLQIAVDALGPAEAEGMIEFGPRMRFHHPLMRSAAYRASDLGDRRSVHGALAAVTDPESDPDRRAWHRAHAVAGPDDDVAAELEASASRAQARGGIAAAAKFLERATALTADAAMRGSRAIAAAQAKRDAAAPEEARDLLDVATLAPLDPLEQATVARMYAQMDFASSRAGVTGAPRMSEAARRLLAAARALEPLDAELARATHLEALAAAMYAGRLADSALLPEVAAAGRAALTGVAEIGGSGDLLLSGMTSRVLDGPGAGAESLRVGLENTNADTLGDGPVTQWPFPIVQESAAHELWDDAVLQRIAADMVRKARDTGALAVLPPALAYRAGVHVYTGEFASAATLIEEANAITASIGNMPVKYHSLTLAAWRGDPENAVGPIEEAATDAAARGEGRLVGLSGYLFAALYNGLGRYEEALAAARGSCEYEDLGFYSWSLCELVEAAVHTGDRAEALRVLPLLEERAGRSDTDWGSGVVAAARALLADAKEAEAHFVEAIELLERAGITPQVARTRLSYGEWLRRAGRRNDARDQLSRAHDVFRRMGADAFAERARRELTAVGEKVRRQAITTGDELTAQEAQIASLAGDGLTNQEIGAQLFISAHTVEWHLRKVFAKLGITSRRQLRTTSRATAT